VAEPDPSDPQEPRSILATIRASNEFDGERRRRFVIRPQELRAAERSVESSGRVVVGFYHSHPDHPARPSQFDQDHAWPWYTYVVVAVTSSSVAATAAFELDPDSRTFHEVSVDSGGDDGAKVTASLRAPRGS
jgi:proteasome lid subunit RPN8/RPN11